MDQKNNLSVIIITKNEAINIAKCIKNVNLVQPREIIVIDDNSTDDTVIIAENLGVKIFSYIKKDFADIRNYAAKIALGKWLLYVDADEIISTELSNNIIKAIASDTYQAYRISRQNYYLGKQWPKMEYLERLIRKDALIQWFGQVHESAQIRGKIGAIDGEMKHYTHRSLSEMLENTVIWSEIEAKLRFQAHHPAVVWWRIPRMILTTFWAYYIVQGGWRVGTVGLIESIYQAFSMFITYSRLWELQNK